MQRAYGYVRTADPAQSNPHAVATYLTDEALRNAWDIQEGECWNKVSERAAKEPIEPADKLVVDVTGL
ncbi:hypothetical protein MMC18_008212, partial [Xylographa bjoerkii]|nr:hypothetical protein [Xylographa bjoerkii]